jgi:multiple sugar transport system ATP-binding protein
VARVLITELTKRYAGGAVAVNKLNLDIADGEFMCLVGPSGCGKTTALRMVAGLEDITSGEVRIGNRVVNNLPPRDRDIAMVFQSYALYPHMSVYDNMAFGLQLRKRPKEEIDKAVHDAARILDLERFLTRKPGQLSGGQRQRVALGRAIVREPSAFLMDEPLSNLDAKLRVQTRAEIARLHQRLKSTMIYVTHDQVEAMTMGDRIAIMSLGQLQQVGTPKEVYASPQNRFVAGFIGSPSMNFVDAKVAMDGAAPRLVGDGLEVTLDDRQAALMKNRGKDSVVVGVRPEHLTVGSQAGPGLRLTATADVIEFLGNQELVHGASGGHDIVAIIDAGSGLEVGQKVEFSAAPRFVHLFDPETDLALANS